MQAELNSAPDGLFAGRTPRIHVNSGGATVAVQGKQASTSNVITVRVTDDGRTNMTDTASFTVVVGDCVQPSLGQQILLAGQSGRVPINLISSVPLTNLGMTLVSPPGHFVSFALEPIVPDFIPRCASLPCSNL
jgi:hypothetical protein